MQPKHSHGSLVLLWLTKMGQSIVAAVSYQGFIYVFTSGGDIYQMWQDENTGRMMQKKVSQINVN
jgi:hypothetical protein